MIVEEAATATDDVEDLERLYSFRWPIQVRGFLSPKIHKYDDVN
jgi:hypothetical protein